MPQVFYGFFLLTIFYNLIYKKIIFLVRKKLVTRLAERLSNSLVLTESYCYPKKSHYLESEVNL